MSYRKDSLGRLRLVKNQESIGKPIQLRPPVNIRKLLEQEAEREGRSLNNLLITILRRYFAGRSADAQAS